MCCVNVPIQWQPFNKCYVRITQLFLAFSSYRNNTQEKKLKYKVLFVSLTHRLLTIFTVHLLIYDSESIVKKFQRPLKKKLTT